MRLKTIIAIATTLAIIASCSSNNCPLENAVYCNYSYYDADGTPITYGDEITVTTLMPGWKMQYSYRKLGYVTEVRNKPDQSLIEQGYTETVQEVRRDTILLNRSRGQKSIKLPMSYYNAEDTLIFSYASISLKDTIKIRHDSYPHVDLPECGSYRYHTITNVTSTDAAISRIEIANPTVNYEGNENIKIYFNGIAE